MKEEEIKCDYAKHYEAFDWCTLSDNPCFKETGDCDEWNELNELIEEESSENRKRSNNPPQRITSIWL